MAKLKVADKWELDLTNGTVINGSISLSEKNATFIHSAITDMQIGYKLLEDKNISKDDADEIFELIETANKNNAWQR